MPKLRGLLAKGATLQSIADIFKVAITTISAIKTGQNWNHIEEENE